jgi:hypothetical protein
MPKIDGRELYIQHHFLDKVTYVPSHADGSASHKDSKQGVIISFTEDDVKVLYCEGRTVQSTRPEDLVWG